MKFTIDNSILSSYRRRAEALHAHSRALYEKADHSRQQIEIFERQAEANRIAYEGGDRQLGAEPSQLLGPDARRRLEQAKADLAETLSEQRDLEPSLRYALAAASRLAEFAKPSGGAFK